MDNTPEAQEPAHLPLKPADCHTLRQWRELVQGKSQKLSGAGAGLLQARISEVEIGKVVPRRKHWPQLMQAFGLPAGSEADFYRMILNARREYRRQKAQEKGLQEPLSKTAPLLTQQKTHEQPKIDPIFGAEETIRRAAEGSAEAQAILQEKMRKAKLA